MAEDYENHDEKLRQIKPRINFISIRCRAAVVFTLDEAFCFSKSSIVHLCSALYNTVSITLLENEKVSSRIKTEAVM